MNYRYGNIDRLKYNIAWLRDMREQKEWMKQNPYPIDPARRHTDIHKWDAMYGETTIQ